MTLAKSSIPERTSGASLQASPLPARDRKVPAGSCVPASWRMFRNVIGLHVLALISGCNGDHLATPLWILNPISQITPHSSRATATFTLLWWRRRLARLLERR
jgi:hypothetical protein